MNQQPAMAVPERALPVVGLDSLRLIAALLVVVSHLANNIPVPHEANGANLLWRAIVLPANGPAAVALFFVISGFCIHLGQVRTLRVEPVSFLARRAVRIGAPLAAISLLAWWAGEWATAGLRTVLWSIYCELLYYFTYPVLLAARRRWSMPRLMMAAMAASCAVVLAAMFHEFEFQYDWATALAFYPLWLAGAWLAERHRAGRVPACRSVAGWRLAAMVVLIATRHANFPPDGLPVWLPFAAAGIFSWYYLPRELARRVAAPPNAHVERWGRASYSLYLVHMLPLALYKEVVPAVPFWSLIVGLGVVIGLLTFCFYTLCEWPAHQVARRLGRKVVAAPAVALA